MTTKPKQKNNDKVLIKFRAPQELKHAVQELADDRNIALSALLRLIITEYVKRYQTP